MRAIGGASKELRKEVANLNRDADNGDGWKDIDLIKFEEGETAIRIGSFSMQVGSSGEGSKITVMAK